MQPKIFLKVICPPGTHCPTCRDLDGGRAWREAHATRYELPPGGVDFECPHGHRWGDKPPPNLPRWTEAGEPSAQGVKLDSKGNEGCGCAE